MHLRRSVPALAAVLNLVAAVPSDASTFERDRNRGHRRLHRVGRRNAHTAPSHTTRGVRDVARF